MAEIDWFDVAPAIAFAAVAGLLTRFIGGKPLWGVFAGVIYIIGAGYVASAGVAYLGFDGAPGFLGSVALSGILIVPLWLYALAADRTPVSEVEMDETVAQVEPMVAELVADLATGYEVWDAAAQLDSHLENLLWRLASDAPRRAEIVAARARLGNAMAGYRRHPTDTGEPA